MALPHLHILNEHDEFCSRWLAGVPEGVETQGYMPLEWGVDYLNGVSFRKGCYLGQELMARTHFTGQVRKRAMPVLLLPAHAPPAPPLFAESLLSQHAVHSSIPAGTQNTGPAEHSENVPQSGRDAAGVGPPSPWQRSAARGALWESHRAQEQRLQGRWQEEEDGTPPPQPTPPPVCAPTIHEMRAAVGLAASAAGNLQTDGGDAGTQPPPAPGAAILTGAGRKAGRMLSTHVAASPSGVQLGFAVLKLAHAEGVMNPPITPLDRQGGAVYPPQGASPADCPPVDLVTAGEGGSFRLQPWVPPHFAALQADESGTQSEQHA